MNSQLEQLLQRRSSKTEEIARIETLELMLELGQVKYKDGKLIGA